MCEFEKCLRHCDSTILILAVRCDRIFISLDCGIVGVNDGIISTCNAPFGGVKESGMGREGSPLGMSEYLETKYIFMNV